MKSLYFDANKSQKFVYILVSISGGATWPYSINVHVSEVVTCTCMAMNGYSEYTLIKTTTVLGRNFIYKT